MVQFIHESVRDFLLKDNGLAMIWPEFGTFQSHEILKESCTSYIEKIHDHGDLSEAAFRFPFLKYSYQHVFDHSEAAAGSLSQGDFLSSFPLQKWIRIHNSFDQSIDNQLETSARLVYILADKALPKLLETRVQQRLESTGGGTERYKYPFFAAFASGSRDALAALLELSLPSPMDVFNAAGSYEFNYEQRTPLTWAVSHRLVNLAIHLVKQGASLTESDRGRLTPLRMAIQVGETSLIALLLNGDGSAERKFPEGDRVPNNARDEAAVSHITALLGLGPTEARKPLCSPVALEDPTVARLLYEAGAGIHDRDTQGHTPLALTVIHRYKKTLAVLIEAGADININDRDIEGRTPLFHAVVNGDEPTAEFLLQSGARIRDQDKFQTGLNLRDAFGNAPLHRAIRNSRQVLAKLLIDFGADLNACSSDGSPPLHLALNNGQEFILKHLVEHGADLNAGNSDGETLLHLAAKRGLVEVAEMLVNHEDVNINTTDSSGFTPLHTAFTSYRNYNDVVVRLLLEHGADIGARTKTGSTPLHVCASNPSGEAKMLIEHGAEIDARDNQGLTPLYFACRAAWIPNTFLLLRHGADAMVRNSEGSTLLHLACNEEGDNYTTVCQLINVGADVNARDNRGSTPLHVAAQKGNRLVARDLIGSDADVNIRDMEGRTPRDVADRSLVHIFGA